MKNKLGMMVMVLGLILSGFIELLPQVTSLEQRIEATGSEQGTRPRDES